MYSDGENKRRQRQKREITVAVLGAPLDSFQNWYPRIGESAIRGAGERGEKGDGEACACPRGVARGRGGHGGGSITCPRPPSRRHAVPSCVSPPRLHPPAAFPSCVYVNASAPLSPRPCVIHEYRCASPVHPLAWEWHVLRCWSTALLQTPNGHDFSNTPSDQKKESDNFSMAPCQNIIDRHC